MPRFKEFRCVTTYALEYLGGIEVAKILPYFANLPVDAFLEVQQLQQQLNESPQS
jgi:hypothetical protein